MCVCVCARERERERRNERDVPIIKQPKTKINDFVNIIEMQHIRQKHKQLEMRYYNIALCTTGRPSAAL